MQSISFEFYYFNSQPHKEADEVMLKILYDDWHFNSQPHKEADGFTTAVRKLCLYFNSQPHKEADCTPDYSIANREIFQFTASQGG